jgi:hypothetical protein
MTPQNSIETNSNTTKIILVLVLSIIAAISLYTSVTTPRLWVDEGKTVDLARNFMNFRTLDIQVSPDKFTGMAPSLQSTGYPVSIPLALFFKTFGLGPYQARIFMLIWLLIALFSIFFYANKIFDDSRLALFSFLLISSFASFHDSGRTVVGEVPGFIFLLVGLNYWLNKNNYYKAGLFWGLAVVTKPAVFALIIPAITLTLIEKNIESIKKIAKIALGMVPAAIVWFIVVVKESPIKTLNQLGKFYSNPYSSSISENVVKNIENLPFQSTIIYFGGLFILILIARYLIRNREVYLKKFYDFVIIYSIFAFIYYLRSPGWLRYILISELLILFILPYTLKITLENIKQISSDKTKGLLTLMASALIIFQTIQIFTISNIYSSTDTPDTISYINANLPNLSVATFQLLEVHAFINNDKRYTTLDLTGLPTIGVDPLSAGILPDILVGKKGEMSDEKILIDKYDLLQKIGRYEIYKIKNIK